MMSIVLARVDNRLIHGQVLQAWIPRIKATAVVVAQDDVAADPVRRAIMEIALPQEIKGVFLRVDELNEWLKNGKTEGERVVILFEDIQGMHRAVKNGLNVACVNIGNVHFQEGKRRLSTTVSLDDDEICLLAEIALTMSVEIRSAPDDAPISLDEALKGVGVSDACELEHKGFWDKVKTKFSKKTPPPECGDVGRPEAREKQAEAKVGKK